ncbi:MAG: protein kinase domain-containing protein, partial [Mycobacteriales bacterium]
MGSTAVADPLVGTVLDGRYRVDRMLARGGMSTVYAGTDLRLDRWVAVKVMAPALAHDPAFTDRFVREARTAARLSHPHAVAVFDQGAEDTRAGRVVFLVMELVPGGTLRDVLRQRGRLRPDEAVSLLEPVLAALAGAHRAGLVHRDVKPENVLIAPDGTVKVVDFGLARAVAAPSTSTQAGVVLGTVAYVAPEQVTRGAADPRTDVYSAGILLFELLTGGPPYAGDSAIAVAYRHVHDDVPPPSSRAPGIAPALDELVQRATRREPGARPPDAGALLAELAMVRADLGLRHVPPRDVVPPADPATVPADPATVPAGLAGGPALGRGDRAGAGPGRGRAAPPGWAPA